VEGAASTNGSQSRSGTQEGVKDEWSDTPVLAFDSSQDGQCPYQVLYTESGSCTSFPMPLCQPKVCSRIVIVPHRPVDAALRRKNASSSPELKMLKEQKVGIVQEKKYMQRRSKCFWQSRQK
jgi:hypothetical protein